MATMRQPLSFDGVHDFLDTLFGDDLHAKRVKSLAGATLGAIQSASLAVGLIGQGLALARGRLTKHAVKQVDRLLSNQGIDVDARTRFASGQPADLRGVGVNATDQITEAIKGLVRGRHGRRGVRGIGWPSRHSTNAARDKPDYHVLIRCAREGRQAQRGTLYG